MREPCDARTELGPGPDLASYPGDARARTDRLLFERCARGDQRARTELVERFMPLARSLARRYDGSGEQLEDLVQVSALALVKAIDRFDPSRGYAFTSFAVPTIVGELKRWFRDRTWSVRPPRDLQELIMRMDREHAKLAQQLDRAPTVAEIAEAAGTSEEHVLEAMQARAGRATLSIHAPQSADLEAAALEDSLGDHDAGYARAEARVLLDGLSVGLSARAREILRLRFESDLTQAEIGQRLEISQMQVSRIIRHSVAHLQHIAEHREATSVGGP